jgi:four helix bundle protein
MRRTAVSVPSNIAEGYSRKNRPEYIQFLRISYRSLAELETQLSLSADLQFVTEPEASDALKGIEETSRLLFKLIQSLER